MKLRDILRAYGYFKKNGIRDTISKIRETMLYRKAGKIYMAENSADPAELSAQRKRRFVKSPRFSVVVPLYNSDPDFLSSAIESVIAQSYEKWELILIDGSSLSEKGAEETAEKYTDSDSRIRYRRLGSNLGISGNTDYGVSVSSGEYVAFLDHDDILMPDALFRAAIEIERTGADFLYSDEMSFSGDPSDISAVTLKPDFGEYTLRGINYIGHLCIVKRQLYDAVGGLRKGFEGSQDYDLALRLSEKAEKTVHLPYVLYGWRIHRDSVSMGIEAKSYCLESAKKAISEHIEKRGIKAEISDVPGAESAYRLVYESPEDVSVCIVVCFEGSERRYDKYINDILDLVCERRNVEVISVGGYDVTDEVKNIEYTGEYSFTAMANIGARNTDADCLMFLDSCVMPRGDFLGELLPYCLFDDVGCAGGVLLSKYGKTAACGYALDSYEILKPYLKGIGKGASGYMRGLKIAHNVSCMSGGFLMVRRRDFITVGGFDERLGTVSGGADLCLRLINRGGNVINPYARAVVLNSRDEDFSVFAEKYEDLTEQGDPYIREIL